MCDTLPSSAAQSASNAVSAASMPLRIALWMPLMRGTFTKPAAQPAGASLRSMTGGRGGYSMEFSHYEEVPAFLAEKVIKEAKAEKESAEKRPPMSLGLMKVSRKPSAAARCASSVPASVMAMK